MKRLIILILAVAAMCLPFFSANTIAVKAADNVAAYTLDFGDVSFADKVSAAFVPEMYGGEDELNAHWKVEGGVLQRVNDLYGEDVTGNYAVAYLGGCYLRYFELSTKIACGEKGLTGVVFGKNDLKLRHFADGNAVYLMSGASVELAGSTITKKVTSSMFNEKTGYYDFKLVLCKDYVKVYIDGVERIDAVIPEELIRYGRIGLFTANTDGAFSGGVELYNLDEHGNRIELESYTAVTGVVATQKNVEMPLSDGKVKYAYSVQPSGATVQGVRFLSVNPDIAVVDNDGYIHPLKAGVTEIEVITTDGGYKDSIVVTVTEIIPELEGVTLDKTSGKIDGIGGKLYLSASYYPEDAENLGFKWSTSNTKVAIVNNGTVTAMGEGTCVITVKDYYGNYSATCTVTVEEGKAEESTQKSGGCKGTVGTGLSVSALGMAAAVALLKRKER